MVWGFLFAKFAFDNFTFDNSLPIKKSATKNKQPSGEVLINFGSLDALNGLIERLRGH